MKKLYLLLFSLLITSFSFGQIWTEDFSGYAENTGIEGDGVGAGGSTNIGDYPGSVSKWTLDASNSDLFNSGDFAKTVSGVFTFQDTDGTGGVIWESESIDISGAAGAVSFQLTASNNAGGFETSDYYNVSYSVDGGSFTLIQDWNNLGDGTHTILGEKGSVDWNTVEAISAGGISGTSLKIQVQALNSAAAEVFYLDDISVFEGAPDPSISITSPSDFEILTHGTASVDLEFTTANLVGGEQVDITVTKNGGSPVTTNNVLSSPFTITPTADGDSFEVTAELVDGIVIDFETINFSIQTTPQTLPISDGFNYPDGSLVPNGGWYSTGGTAGDFLVSSNQAVVTHGIPSEDVNLEFTTASRILYCGLDFSVDDLGAPYVGTDNEYFFHFLEIGTFEFMGRLDIVPPSSSGDFSVGIASGDSTADATWAADFTFGVTYRAVIKIDMDTNQAQLWIDATLDSDTSILGDDLVDDLTIAQNAIGLRQSDSSENETVRVDNVKISTTFNDVVLGVNDNQIKGFSFSPNPTSLGYVDIKSRTSTPMNVSVFDLLGKQVIKETISDSRLNVSSLNAGVYIMKVSQDDATTTKKLVIK